MIERVPEIGWTLGHLDDLDADFLRYYGRDWTELDGPRFFTLAERVGAYGGVIAFRYHEATRDDPEAEPDDWDSDPALAGLVEVR